MKKTFSLIMLAIMMATGARAQKMVVKTTDQQMVMYDIPNVESVSFVDGYVDLGLPSGTLWATCNVGASSPEEYGDFFAWGETEPKSEYAWTNYFDYDADDASNRYKKYNNDGGLTELLPEDDAAAANWNEGWQMPSKEQFEELIDPSYTTTVWTEQNGVYGRMIIGKNSNSIFLPAAGFCWGMSHNTAGSDGYYWSRTLNASSGLAEDLCFGSSGISGLSSGRGMGFSVRPVVYKAPKLVTAIALNPSTLSLQPDGTQQLTATVVPENASYKAVTWTSSDVSVATVSTSGLVTAKALGICTITCSAKDGSGVKAVCYVTVNDGTIYGHEYVEIGGLKWAKMNIGATTVAGSHETCFGDYFAWGEIEPRYTYINRLSASTASFTWKDNFSDGHSIANQDTWPTYKNTKLDAEHDAATANWGGSWRTPTEDECKALVKACSGSDKNFQKPIELISTIIEGGIYWLSSMQTIEPNYTGVAGLLFVSKDDISKRVFFPAAGRIFGTSFCDGGIAGDYWSASIKTDNTWMAKELNFTTDNTWYVFPSGDSSRCQGQTVRPVSK